MPLLSSGVSLHLLLGLQARALTSSFACFSLQTNFSQLPCTYQQWSLYTANSCGLPQ